MNTLAERLEAFLKRKQWTLGELQRETGLSKGYLSQLVRGEQPNPSLETLRALARAFDTTVADLIGEPVEAKAVVQMPKSLETFLRRRAREGRAVSEEEVQILSAMELRGQHPKTDEDWAGLLWAIQRAIRPR
jgi:transcriptional regulator with XRE-family HTH domain